MKKRSALTLILRVTPKRCRLGAIAIWSLLTVAWQLFTGTASPVTLTLDVESMELPVLPGETWVTRESTGRRTLTLNYRLPVPAGRR